MSKFYIEREVTMVKRFIVEANNEEHAIAITGNTRTIPEFVYTKKDEVKYRGEAAKCPRCGKYFAEGLGALSRRDNETVICSDCGTFEAMEDFEKNMKKEK